MQKHYPTSVLVTAFDIIFFWVARMMMMGLHFMKNVPFRDVYIHALVLDEKGQKMSKSKGNVIDPLGLIDRYGADALRFTLAAQAAQGRNIRLSEPRVEGYRNFATKLWNAARFCEMNECKPDSKFDPGAVKETLNQWIIHEAIECAATVTREIEAYRFNDAAGAIYKFVWNVFCDWYLELAKPALQGDAVAAQTETRATAAWTLGQALKLLHPFMPFVTEELWATFKDSDCELIVAEWPYNAVAVTSGSDRAKVQGYAPTVELVQKYALAADTTSSLVGFVSAVRSARQENNVPAAAKIPMVIVSGTDKDRKILSEHGEAVKRLARISEISFTDSAPEGSIQIIHGDTTAALSLAEVIDIAAERARLQKEIATAGSEIEKIDKKLGNRNFVERAPAEVVEEQKTRRADYAAQREKLTAALARLEGL